MLVDTVAGRHAELSDGEKTAIQEQLARLLADSHFSQSRRFPSFLRYVVKKTLAGQDDALKERTLGIEIFGRRPDYDTATDPIVRVTAAEIRKRIAQYYQDPGHDSELRVSLPPGSYIPQFHWPETAKQYGGAQAAIIPLTPALVVDQAVKEEPGRISIRTWFWRLAIVFVLALLCVGAAFLWQSAQLSPFNFFWGPVIHSNGPVLFCVADQSQYSAISLRDAEDPTHQTLLKDNLTAIIIDDLNPIVRLAGLLQSSGKMYNLKAEGATDLTDLRNGPTIFVGAFDNAWTLRLTKALRYHFANNTEMTEFRIVDSTDPTRPRWVINRLQQMTTNDYRDFAIVARFTDSTTGKLAVVAAGVGRGGTRVAGEFLTEPANLAQLERAAAREGNKKNLEVVLSTQIIDGQPGTPKVEASYFW
jgi:hypothetical protein